MTILFVDCAVIRKKWDSYETEADDGKVDVYKDTMMLYNGDKIKSKEHLKDILRSINELDWDRYLHNANFWSSESSSSS